jgi:hypothetical protein
VTCGSTSFRLNNGSPGLKGDDMVGEIGLASLLAIPRALKFVWAPVVDRYNISRINSRSLPTRMRVTAGLRLSYAMRCGTQPKCAKARTCPPRKQT